MLSPVYSLMSNPHCVSRMGTVHYTRNNGNHSAVPMMPMYGGPVFEKIRGAWNNLSDEQKDTIKTFGIEQGTQALSNRFANDSTTPTTTPTTTSTGTDPKKDIFKKTKKIDLSKTKPVVLGPSIGQRGPVGMRRPVVQTEETLLEKISKNRFNIVLASSALLLGVILINRRRQ